jgi:uncharacterized membrane protein (DUF485 family)
VCWRDEFHRLDSAEAGFAVWEKYFAMVVYVAYVLLLYRSTPRMQAKLANLKAGHEEVE